MFPRFSLHGMPEPHPEGLAHGASGGSHTPEPPGREGAGGIAPSSVTSFTPADLGLPSQPAGGGRNALMPHLYVGESFMPVDMPGGYYICGRKTSTGFHTGTVEALYQRDPTSGIYKKTDLKVHRDGSGRWVLDNPAPSRTASTSPQPGPSDASSSQAAAETEVPHVLEDLLSHPLHREPGKQYFIGKDAGDPFHIFQHKKMRSAKMESVPTVPNRLLENRQAVAEAVESVLVDLHYEVVLHNENMNKIHLEVTNPQTGKHFLVYVRLSSGDSYHPLGNPPINEAYLMAMVHTDPVSGELKTLRLVPFFHPWRTF